MNSFRALVRAHQMTVFFALALGVTWLAFIPFYASGGDSIPWFTFGPAVAGFAVAAMAGGWAAVRPILGSMGRWRIGAVWYAAALGLPFGAQLVSVLLNPLFGSAPPAWGTIPPLAQTLPTIFIFAVFSGPLGEEPGWRGFAMPRLLAEHSALAASLILGLVWTVWHLPLGLLGDLSLYGSVTTMLAAVVFAWMHQNTRGSVLLAILMHVSHQNSVRYLGKVYEGADAVQQQWIGTAIWALFVAAILMVYGTRSFAGRSRGGQTFAPGAGVTAS